MVRGRGAAEGVDNKIIIMTKATEKTERTYALQLNANCEAPEELERERVRRSGEEPMASRGSSAGAGAAEAAARRIGNSPTYVRSNE